MKKALIIGGASSGSGKTTFSIGLMQALSKRGIDVAPFKVGPDYIDPMFHRHVTQKKAYNLPVWMVSDETVKYLYHKRFEGHEFAVIEGVMGYYDGKYTDKIEGSTAHVAEILGVDALIIFDASSMSLSAAAIVHGFSTFLEKNRIKGVILNNVASAMHYQLLKDGIERFTKVKCYGYLKKDPRITLGSRHLGLLQAEEIQNLDEKIEYISEQIEATVDLDGIIEDFNAPEHISEVAVQAHHASIEKALEVIRIDVESKGGLRIGVPLDRAFSFYYDENLETLKEIGITLVPISPLADEALPDSIDGLYIGGGYPEVFGEALSQNITFRSSVKRALDQGLPCYAECGGLMYLTKAIHYQDADYNMVGFLNASTEMTAKLQRFGLIDVVQSGVLGRQLSFRAHEFHKSIIHEAQPIQKCYDISKGSRTWQCGFYQNNTLATYAHNHFYSNLKFLALLVELWGIQK